ncbi:flagellar hook-length control protein FliK [Bradyrhizobium sp. BWA-3-5]|uniref:flagellar hook-length control protein FliK n=1 Tax=Bradyrhizobium sp. BWA-3-5 TaxID=3080013 RepID=UPI00293F5813|nr:flagellar hook-length control protein FliK [Bradyrhizobium sp. BWA-3-5]WOH67521.1 flagellar hook-length control protein FliK [Bradyrhizobium sp. BWA-3-5]
MANASFQSAAAKSARPDSDPPAGNDSFAALVDSNTAASRNDNRAQDHAPAPRRSDDTPASGSRARDNAAASDKAARNDSNDRNAAAKARNDKARNDDNVRDDGKADAKADTDTTVDADTKATTTRRTKSKSDAPKSDKVNSDETTQATSGDISAADQTEMTQNGTTVTTADAIAAAIPAAATPTQSTSAAPANDKAAAPLAIAAAAIAASASVAAETAPATPSAEATDGDTGATSPAAANGAPAETTVKTAAQAGVGQAVSAQATSGDPSVIGGIAQAAAVVAATPAATKSAVPSKGADLAKKGATAAVEQQPGTIDSTDTAAPTAPAADTIVSAVTPPTEAAAKPKTDGLAEAVKADTSGNAITPPAAPANASAQLAGNVGQTPVNASVNGLQAVGAVPTQQPNAHAAAPAAASQLTATAATDAAVPVSGLAMEIAASARSGKTRFEIRLDPAELGRIDVRIDVDRHGQVMSHLTVERPETLSMLRQDANQLQRALDNAGLSTGNGGLQFSLRDQSSQGQNDGNQGNPNAHRIVVSEEDSVPAVVAGRSYGRMLGASGGVDISV